MLATPSAMYPSVIMNCFSESTNFFSRATTSFGIPRGAVGVTVRVAVAEASMRCTLGEGALPLANLSFRACISFAFFPTSVSNALALAVAESPNSALIFAAANSAFKSSITLDCEMASSCKATTVPNFASASLTFSSCSRNWAVNSLFLF